MSQGAGGKAFCVSGNGPLEELATPVGLALPHCQRPASLDFVAIWDTGATGCAITREAAVRIGAKPCGLTYVAGVHGTHAVDTYYVSLHLPMNVSVPIIEATELDQSAGCDFLIGMDVIRMGDFAVSNLGGNTTFTFRIPSLACIDFTKD